MLITLESCHGWNGKSYGPGEVEVPDALAIALGYNPKPPEPIKEAPEPGESEMEAEELVNLNTATAEEIAAAVNGVGLATARKIVELRSQLPNGITSLEQLRSIPRLNIDDLKILAL